MSGKSQVAVLLLALGLARATAAEVFPQPEALQPDVDFWVRIFTEFTTDQGVLHDARNLAVVYESIDFPPDSGRRSRQREIVKRRKAVQAVLARLAAGNRGDLDAVEARILALWPDGVDSGTLVAASRNVRFQQGLKDRFRDGLVRAGRWREHIEHEFEALGIPPELAALPHVESSYNPAARSHVGASGIWQFTRSTGRRFLRIDHVVDERNDPFAASRAAGQLLAYNYSITGNWPMAITAYNHGLAGARRAMRQFGDTAYTEILRNYRGRTFGFASRNFYVAFLAAMQVDRNVDRYFPGLVPDPPVAFQTASLDHFIAAGDLTAALGVTPRQFAEYNPALQATIWQGSKYVPKGYEIRLPADALARPLAELLAAIDPAAWRPDQLPDLFHTVRRGDTLSEIAETYDTRVSTLMALNNLRSSNRIRAGQRLRLPAAGPAPAAEPVAAAPAVEPPTAGPPAADVAGEPADTSGGLASTLLGSLQSVLLSDPSDYSVADDGTIEIQPLETLGHFADWLDIRTQRLRDINGLAFRTPVAVGERIRLDLSRVDAKSFEDKRVAWHREQQDAYFRRHVITGVREHVVARGESIWILALRKYDVPMWLIRQYNPELDLQSVRPGTTLRFPQLAAVDTG
jgi:membrane-bound lytic murein transglycosylase D